MLELLRASLHIDGYIYDAGRFWYGIFQLYVIPAYIFYGVELGMSLSSMWWTSWVFVIWWNQVVCGLEMWLSLIELVWENGCGDMLRRDGLYEDWW